MKISPTTRTQPHAPALRLVQSCEDGDAQMRADFCLPDPSNWPDDDRKAFVARVATLLAEDSLEVLGRFLDENSRVATLKRLVMGLLPAPMVRTPTQKRLQRLTDRAILSHAQQRRKTGRSIDDLLRRLVRLARAGREDALAACLQEEREEFASVLGYLTGLWETDSVGADNRTSAARFLQQVGGGQIAQGHSVLPFRLACALLQINHRELVDLVISMAESDYTRLGKGVAKALVAQARLESVETFSLDLMEAA